MLKRKINTGVTGENIERGIRGFLIVMFDIL